MPLTVRDSGDKASHFTSRSAPKVKANVRHKMKRPIIAILVAAVAAGCTPDVTVRITDADSNPIVGARVERYRPPHLGEKIVNPVGSFYHDTLAEAKTTDAGGNVTVAPAKEGGYYFIYSGTNQAITVKWGDRTLSLTADPSDPSIEWKYYMKFSSVPESIVTNWVYSITREKDGKIIGHDGTPTWKHPLPEGMPASP